MYPELCIDFQDNLEALVLTLLALTHRMAGPGSEDVYDLKWNRWDIASITNDNL